MEYLQRGNVKIKKTAALAPMAGVADYAFRTVAKEFGAAYVVGEMASCKGMVYSDRKTAELLTVTDYERPMAVQLFGCDKKFTEAEKVPFAVVCNDGPFKSDIEFSMLHVEKLKNLIRVSIVLENGEVLASHEIRLQER